MFVLQLYTNQYVRHRATITTMKNFLITGTFPNGKVDDDTGVYENNCDLRAAGLHRWVRVVCTLTLSPARVSV